MLLNQNIETQRLVIRSWRRADKDFTLSLWGDKENGRYMSDPSGENMDERYLECIDEMEDSEDGYYLLAEFRDSGEPVGTCCAFPEKDNYDIGYCISKDFWKQGLGSEMVGALIEWIKSAGGKSVTAEVADINAASVALLKKLGFAEDRKSVFKKWGEDEEFEAHFYKLFL